MEADESGTIARQKAHRDELIDPKFSEHKWSSAWTVNTLFATRNRWPFPKEYEELFLKGLRLAGVPDGPLDSKR